MAKEKLLCLNILKEVIGICCTLGLLLLIGACNLLCSTNFFRRQLVRFPVFLRMRDLCEIATHNWNVWGKVMSTTWSVFSIASFGFFIAHTILHPKQIVFVKTRADDILVYIDLGLNLYFVIFFIIRFIGTNDKWSFIVSSSTWMEVLTIGPALTAVLGEEKQLMFSFLRALRLACLKDLLFVVGIVRRSQMKTLTNIVVNIFCFWCVFAGIIYQTENLTDFTKFENWKFCPEDPEGQTGGVNFFRSMYFLLVTASSVGYGDITPSNVPTKVVIIIFVALAVTFFASILPDIYAVCSVPQNFGNRSFYTGASEGHIIYCGSSQLNKLKSFFWNFYYNIALSSDGFTRVCFLQGQQVSEQITWFLRSFCGRITVVFGSPSDAEFLMQSCKLNSAEAIILTSEAGGTRSDFEADRINYVRTIGLKLCAPQCRTIVQIKSMFHKQSFRALPLWRTRQGKPGELPPDAVLCDNQVLLGLMGINSVAPGMATLLINLLSYRESKSSLDDEGGGGGSGGGGGAEAADAIGHISAGQRQSTVNSGWRTAYSAGIQVKLYCVGFTAKHRDYTFKSLSLQAFQVYGVLLIGVCMVDKLTGVMTGVINPSFDSSFVINPSTMRAFLVSRSVEAVRHFAMGAPSGFNGVLVHGGGKKDDKGGDAAGDIASKTPEPAGRHDLELRDAETSRSAATDESVTAGISFDLSDDPDWPDAPAQQLKPAPKEPVKDSDLPAQVRRASATYGHQEERRLEDWYRDSIDARCRSQRELHAAEHEVPPLLDITGTLHWAPNRRCRKLSVDEAKTIEFRSHILVAIIGSLQHPIGLSSLVLPLRNRSIPVDQLSDIVILGNAESIERHEWRGIRNFPFIYVVDGNGVYPQHLLYCRAHKAAAMTVLNLAQRTSVSNDPFLADKMTLLCTENLRGIGAKDCHVTSELFYSPNAYCFSDPRERRADISVSDVMDTQSFAEGLVVSSPNLTGLLASVYFCPEVLAFLESIIHGSNQPSVDDYLSLDFCIPSCFSRSDSADLSRVFGFRLLLLWTGDFPLREIFQAFDCKEIKWEDLVISCLDRYNIMCLGVYRRRTIKRKANAPETASGWFVMTYPDPETQIDLKDRIFCFAPPSQTQKQQQQQQQQQQPQQQ